MYQDVKAVLSRSSATIWLDSVGGISLLVVLYAALHVPMMI